jgi:hypothetical protein
MAGPAEQLNRVKIYGEIMIKFSQMLRKHASSLLPSDYNAMLLEKHRNLVTQTTVDRVHRGLEREYSWLVGPSSAAHEIITSLNECTFEVEPNSIRRERDVCDLSFVRSILCLLPGFLCSCMKHVWDVHLPTSAVARNSSHLARTA